MMVSSAEVHGTEDGVATAAPWPEEEITTGGEMDGFCPRIPSISLYMTPLWPSRPQCQPPMGACASPMKHYQEA